MTRLLTLIKDRLRKAGISKPWGHKSSPPPVLPESQRVLHDYKCVFVHIPKTAGTSITDALLALPRHDVPGSPRVFLKKHAKAVEYREAIGDELWSQYFSFAFVRNPWDLMVSSYHWWQQKAGQIPGLAYHAERVRRLNTFKKFMNSEFGRRRVNEVEGDIFDWLADGDSIIVSYVGKVETISEDWGHICERLGIACKELPILNKTERAGYRALYDKETRRIVERRFRRTIDHFEYEF